MVMRAFDQTPPPLFGNRVGRKMKTPDGSLSSTMELISQYFWSSAHDKSVADNFGIFGADCALAIFSTITVVVPAANNTVAPVRIAVFAFVHAIIFNAPLMRVKVEVEVVTPLASAMAVTVFARDTDTV